MATGSFAAEAKAAIEALRKSYYTKEEEMRLKLQVTKRSFSETYAILEKLKTQTDEEQRLHTKYAKLANEAAVYKLPEDDVPTDTEESATTKNPTRPRCQKCSAIGHYAKSCTATAAKSS